MIAVLVPLLAACGAQASSALHPGGPGAARVAQLWWLMFWISVVVCVLVIGLVLWAWTRRRRPEVQVKPGGGRIVVAAGIVIPALILTGVYAFSVHDMGALVTEGSASGETVEVVGHLWWWEVRYPGRDVVTANEIHIPVGEVVHLRLSTADVNHSFWVPSLMPKTDLIAGRVNEMWLKATKAGNYRGQCAEYCGLQHAHMGFSVVAEDPQQFQAWVTEQAQPAAAPTTALQTRGRDVFTSATCASCHTVRGTSADGKVGPDLTHLATRSRIGAEAVPNTPGYLGGWISNSQTIKPGNLMPPQPLAPEDLQALIAYLDHEGGAGS